MTSVNEAVGVGSNIEVNNRIRRQFAFRLGSSEKRSISQSAVFAANHFFFSTFEFETAVAISVAVITAAVVVVIAVDVVAKVDI